MNMTASTTEQTLTELVERHRALYGGAAIDARLETVIRAGSHTNLTEWDILYILRTSRAVFFDTHVEVVSGHHTATYLRFESIARFPELVRPVAEDMADWITRTFHSHTVAGLVATGSAAKLLADGIADQLRDTMPIRVVSTPFDRETGRIGTDLASGSIAPGERFLALNDVTTRGNCVAKLGGVITGNGGLLAGLMVFARRDSGQFPLVNELIERHPFYYATDLDMPQWEPAHCPLCREHKPLLSWKDMPEL
jgi:orotate phosphoribosyltransferase